MKTKAKRNYTKWILLSGIIVFIGLFVISRLKPNTDDVRFQPVDLSTWDGKTVSDYYREKLRMSPDEARDAAAVGTSFYVSDSMTIDALISNLHYYGLVRDEQALRYALEHSNDSVPGNSNALKIGADKTIDRGYYSLGPNMNTWEIADALLNEPKESKIDYGYMFMPGKPDNEN